MRRMRIGMLGLAAMLVGAVGCQSTSGPDDTWQRLIGWHKPLPDVKPPTRP